jgi:hypothetical protein
VVNVATGKDSEKSLSGYSIHFSQSNNDHCTPGTPAVELAGDPPPTALVALSVSAATRGMNRRMDASVLESLDRPAGIDA